MPAALENGQGHTAAKNVLFGPATPMVPTIVTPFMIGIAPPPGMMRPLWSTTTAVTAMSNCAAWVWALRTI